MHWEDFLKNEFKKEYFIELSHFLKEAYSSRVIYPKREDVFNAFAYTKYEDMKVVLLGQDPYHQPQQAHGLCFSVNPECPLPPSLRNIYKEMCDDLGCPMPKNGYLVHWAKQGVLMLNSILTVEEGKPLSHQGKGWEIFCDHVLEVCNQSEQPLVFILWGKQAQMKERFVTNSHHLVIKSAHPSPLSAYNGFFGSKPFSRTNDFLIKNGRKPIDWSQNV